MRDITSRERAVLAHVVMDPDEWWSGAQVIRDPEAALVAKIASYEDDYDTAFAAGNYQTRAERDAA